MHLHGCIVATLLQSILDLCEPQRVNIVLNVIPVVLNQVCHMFSLLRVLSYFLEINSFFIVNASMQEIHGVLTLTVAQYNLVFVFLNISTFQSYG